jgi:adenine-specific DNA methylase
MVEFVSGLSRIEANSKKPIYMLHKWFGRKTDAVLRSILLSLASPAGYPGGLEAEYYRDNHEALKGKYILDPFMGGGSTLVNTLRLGGKAVGVDVNPVAWFITKNELQVPGEAEGCAGFEDLRVMLEFELERIEAAVGSQIRDAYRTAIKCEDGSERYADVMYFLWIKKAICPECGSEVRLYPKMSITSVDKIGFRNLNFCPACGDIVEGNEPNLICPGCGTGFRRDSRNYSNRRFRCDSCGGVFGVLKDVMSRSSTILDAEMCAIEYYDAVSGRKGFKKPDSRDIEAYYRIKEAYRLEKGELDGFLPDSRIPAGFNTRQVRNHKYNLWSEMFNERQLYFLAKLLREISRIENRVVRELFLCTFSNTLNTNNMFCIYNAQYEKIEPLFGDHNIGPVVNPVENNLWGTRFGRGSFLKNFGTMLDAKQFNYMPFERQHEGGKTSAVVMREEGFRGEFAENFENLHDGSCNTLIKCQSAEDMGFLPDGCIDAVVTDPPYFSAINYGEISEFFYAWQRLLLAGEYSSFGGEHIDSSEEVTVNSVRGISSAEFVRRLTGCFREVCRVLRDDAPLVMTYSSSAPEGWTVLFDSLLEAGFLVTETYPVQMEYKAGLVENRRGKMSCDLVIVARKRMKSAGVPLSFEDFLKMLREGIRNEKKKYEGLNLNGMDRMLVGMGVLYKLYSLYYPDISGAGNPLSFREAAEALYRENI